MTPAAVSPRTFGPPDKVEALRAQRDQRYPFLVRFADGFGDAARVFDFDSSASDVV